MHVRVRRVDLAVTDCVTRLPFRFGIHTLTFAPTLTARVELETDAGEAVGHSADLLVPRWFEKDPGKSLRQDVEGLMQSAVAAARLAEGTPSRSVFDLWWRLYGVRVHGTPEAAPDRLVRGFGVALLERAVMDAACRAAGLSFFEALRQDLFGLRPGEVHAELEGWSLADSLPAAPRERVALRHTVGLLDALTPDEVDARVDDGLPECLEEDLRAAGLRWFKLKLSGDPAADRERCLRFVAVVEANAPEDWRLTVDGNEQFTDLSALTGLLRDLGRDPAGARLLERLQCIEQPLPRGRSFDRAAVPELAALSEIAPVILDEADHGIEAFPRALALGYGGVSVKNCKGVLRVLLNRGLCERHRAFQSAEDLTNLGVLALQQDLATVAALGLGHVERNGHHYFRGLAHLSAREAQGALAAHPDLWREEAGTVALRVEDGDLALGSLEGPGYGYACEIDFESRTPLAAWRYPGAGAGA
jgi:hypothetical protein